MRNIPLVNGTSAIAMRHDRQLSLVRNEGSVERRHRATHRRNDQAFFLGMCAIIVAIGLMSFILSDVAQFRARQAIVRGGTEVIHVVYGDTLWSIAERHSVAGCSTKDVLSWLMQRNDLANARLSPGQTLVVPCGRHTLQEGL